MTFHVPGVLALPNYFLWELHNIYEPLDTESNAIMIETFLSVAF